MTLPPLTRVELGDSHRLIPSRYPPVGILDVVAAPQDLALMIELKGWSDDRISAELGVLRRIPPSEWVVGRPYASVIMAAFCHPRAGGGRFNDRDRGAWYAAFDLATAHAEAVFHRTAELAEIGVFETRLEMRAYLADFAAEFHDVRGGGRSFEALYDPEDYGASQALATELLRAGSNGVLYHSVRRRRGECIACFRPMLVLNVRAAGRFEYLWSGSAVPSIREF